MSAHLWYAIKTPGGNATCIHEMELSRDDVVLFSAADSGRVRDFARQHNEEVAEARKRFNAEQRGLFEEWL